MIVPLHPEDYSEYHSSSPFLYRDGMIHRLFYAEEVSVQQEEREGS